MAKTPYYSVPISIAAGTSGNTLTVTPQTGRITGVCLYHNNDNNAVNSGIVNLSVSTAGGDDILPIADVRHFRNRNAAYEDGFVPMDFNSNGSTFQLKFSASTNFIGAGFLGTFIFKYGPDNCY